MSVNKFKEIKDVCWLERLSKLKCDAVSGIAPHKPLLLLVVLDLVEQGKLAGGLLQRDGDLAFRFSSYWRVVADRRRTKPDVRMPFFHMRTEGYSKHLTKDMFVTQVVGESMLPTIRNGAYCVFRSPVEGTRQGRIVLVQKRYYTDSETGGSYTVKRYYSKKTVQDGAWQHQSIQLKPDNPDRKRFPVLEFSPEDEIDLQVIAEFIQMLDTP